MQFCLQCPLFMLAVQFEGSLGKLTVSSVNNPRKMIDAVVTLRCEEEVSSLGQSSASHKSLVWFGFLLTSPLVSLVSSALGRLCLAEGAVQDFVLLSCAKLS